jgi:hypothetical protein
MVKYTSQGYGREATALALTACGDRPDQVSLDGLGCEWAQGLGVCEAAHDHTHAPPRHDLQVRAFIEAFGKMRELGFTPERAAGALMMHRNDLQAAIDTAMS